MNEQNKNDLVEMDDVMLEDMEDSLETITLTDEDGNEVEHAIIDVVEKDGVSYLLLVDINYVDEDDVDALIFKSVQDDGDEVVYEPLSDAEFDMVAALFQSDNDEYELKL